MKKIIDGAAIVTLFWLISEGFKQTLGWGATTVLLIVLFWLSGRWLFYYVEKYDRRNKD